MGAQPAPRTDGEPTIRGARQTVGVADMKCSATAGDEIVTFALGSCLGITIHDAAVKVGGLLHVVLPHSSVDPARAEGNPLLFIDTAVPLLFQRCYELGAQRSNLIIKVAGGACTRPDPRLDLFQVGKRNVMILQKLLEKNRMTLLAADVGKHHARNMTLEIGTGKVRVEAANETRWL